MAVLFDMGVRRKALRAYLRLAKIVIDAHNFNQAHFKFSSTAFANAYGETQLDCKFLRERRPLLKGISPGKVAGVFAFRLSRNPIISFTDKVIDNPLAFHVPVETAALMGLELVGVAPEKLPVFLVREIKYYIAKRHPNQEALGLFFDALRGASM